ncbi:MAG: DUF1801 domain-containing protein [candidate division Zixibacteria bacterium]|nr:DUF1801 domain-containing protein [candidate division Zixibacteria bacterium]
MARARTKGDAGGVQDVLDRIADEQQREDAQVLLKMMKSVTRKEPVLWGPGMIGFGSYHYKYDSGREGDWFLTGFSPRKNNLSIYIMAGFDRYPELMDKLGKYKTGKSCLYVKRLDDIDLKILKQLVTQSVRDTRARYR